MGSSAESHVLQGVCGPDRNDGGSPNPPEAPDRQRRGGSTGSARSRAGRDLRARASAAWTPNFCSRKTCVGVPARPPRVGASRGRRKARGKPRVRSHGSGRAQGQGVGFGTVEDPVPPSPAPAPAARLGPPRPREPPSAPAGRVAVGSTPGSVPGVRGRPARARGLGTAAAGSAARGLLSASSRAPPLVLARRNAPRCARGGRIQRLLATYKRSLCGAILSLSVCGSRVRPAPRAQSEGRRRRRNGRGAAPVPAEPPPQAEDGRTPRREEPVPLRVSEVYHTPFLKILRGQWLPKLI